MQRLGRTVAGTPRYYCLHCRRSSIIHRRDTRERHIHDHFVSWLIGRDTISSIAKSLGVTRQALWKQFRYFFDAPSLEPRVPDDYKPRVLIVDATFIHGNVMCVLVSVDEDNNIFFSFSEKESYQAWISFLSQFSKPDVVVADGQKGLKLALFTLWPDVDFQRCQFHVIKLIHRYITREPKENAGRELLRYLYNLKKVKSVEKARRWVSLYQLWERRYEKMLKEKTASGAYRHRDLRSARSAVRKALPHLFVFLNHPGAPNTTNLVEGWANTAIAEGLRRHRGIRLHQKRTLVSVILLNLTRKNPTRKLS
jgi:hypothetical protein